MALLFGWLATLFGCNKNKYILDGPGMENPDAWVTFSVSRSGDSYAQHNFHITVTDTADGYVVKGTLLNCEEEEEGILLPKSACRKIDALDPGGLPNVTQSISEESDIELPLPLDTPEIEIEVGYLDGRLLSKVDKDDFSLKVYEIVSPYFREI